MPIILGHARRVQDLALFTRHLAGSMAARAPLAEVAGAFAAEADTRTMQEAIRRITPRLEAGAPLSVAMEEAPSVFPPAYRRLIRMGEESQALPEVAADMATTLEEGVSIHESFRRAAVYPTLILFLLLLLTAFISTTLMPKFQDIYNQLGSKELPVSLDALRILPFLFCTGFLLCFLWVLGAGVGLSWNSYRHARLVLSLPLVGPALRLAETARFVRHLGLLMKNRIPLPEAIGLLAEAAPNVYVRAALEDFQQRVEKGESLGELIAGQPLFPPSLGVLVASAQERGQLPDTLEHLAGFYRERAQNALRIVREFFEPLMLVAVGMLVAILIFSVYLPVIGIPQTLGAF